MPLLTLDNKPLVLKGAGGGQQPCELTITFEDSSTTYLYLDVDGVVQNGYAEQGVSTFHLFQNSLLLLNSPYGYPLTNLVNVTYLDGNYHIGSAYPLAYICTAPTASATQPTD